MKTSQTGIKMICRFEGLRLKAYRCPGGAWTIGFGHTSQAGPPKVTPDLRITEEESLAILKKDIKTCEKRVSKALGRVAQNIFDGAVSFDFNTGAINRASWVKLFKQNNLTKARDAFMLWTKANGRVLPGLLRRRQTEARLIFAPPPAQKTTRRSSWLLLICAALLFAFFLGVGIVNYE